MRIADPLGLSVEEAAAGIRFVVDNKMSDLLRTITIEKGGRGKSRLAGAVNGGGPLGCGVDESPDRDSPGGP